MYLYREDAILCLYRIGSRVANNKYIGSCGGHFEPFELNDPKGCILREMKEELGLAETDVEGLSLRYITHRLVAGEIRQNYYFFARLEEEKKLSSTEGILQWIPMEQIPALNMPVSAKAMILHYLREGCHTNHIYCGITLGNGTNFAVMEDFAG